MPGEDEEQLKTKVRAIYLQKQSLKVVLLLERDSAFGDFLEILQNFPEPNFPKFSKQNSTNRYYPRNFKINHL